MVKISTRKSDVTTCIGLTHPPIGKPETEYISHLSIPNREEISIDLFHFLPTYVKTASSMLLSGLMCKTLSLPLALFDLVPKRFELVKHSDVPMDSLATESVTGPRMVKSEAHGKAASLPRSTERVPDYSLATREKGKRDIRPVLCVNDSRPKSALAHELSRDPHEKRRKTSNNRQRLPPPSRSCHSHLLAGEAECS